MHFVTIGNKNKSISDIVFLTLTQILRLYVAAYQAQCIWKDVWKAQIGVLSPQIVRDCETFVAENAFAAQAIVAALSGRA
jgi:hypothetical protein